MSWERMSVELEEALEDVPKEETPSANERFKNSYRLIGALAVGNVKYQVESGLFRRMIESGILPPGSVQLICGGVGDLFEPLRRFVADAPHRHAVRGLAGEDGDPAVRVEALRLVERWPRRVE